MRSWCEKQLWYKNIYLQIIINKIINVKRNDYIVRKYLTIVSSNCQMKPKVRCMNLNGLPMCSVFNRHIAVQMAVTLCSCCFRFFILVLHFVSLIFFLLFFIFLAVMLSFFLFYLFLHNIKNAFLVYLSCKKYNLEHIMLCCNCFSFCCCFLFVILIFKAYVSLFWYLPKVTFCSVVFTVICALSCIILPFCNLTFNSVVTGYLCLLLGVSRYFLCCVIKQQEL